MREEWKVKIFDEIISHSQIGIVRNNKAQSPKNAFRYFKMSNIRNDNGINEDSFTYVNASDEEVEKYKLVNNDFLFNTRNSFELVGKTCLYISKYTKPTLFNNNILRVRFKPELIPQFVTYLFCTPTTLFELEKIKSGTTNVIGIYYKSLKNIPIPIPPIQEQKQIVALLDKAFTSIDQAKSNIEKNIVNAKELFQSKLNAIFSQKGDGWEEKTLGEVCEKSANIKWQDYPNKEFEYVDLSAVSRESLTITGTTLVNKENAPSRARKIINTGDVIFATTRPTLRRATIINEELSGNLCSTGFVVLRPNDDITTDWIFFYLLTTIFMDRMESLQRGASYPAVSDNDVKSSKLSIPMSKLEEKKNIETMNILQENINDLVFQFQQKLKDLEELKKSILQKAFSGELTQKEVEV
jgi:type I restriction enzyme S subunit